MTKKIPTYEELRLQNEQLKTELEKYKKRDEQLHNTNAEQSNNSSLQNISNNKLLKLFIKNSPIYTFIKTVTSTESRVLYASENFIDMIGIKGSDMIGKNMSELFPPEFAEKMTADDWKVVSDEKILKLNEEFNGKSYITLKYPLIIDGIHILAGYTIEITDLKNIEHELTKAKKLFEAVIFQSPVPMAAATPDGRLLVFNDACKKQLGMKNIKFNDKLLEMNKTWKDYDKDGNYMPTEKLPLALALQGIETKDLEIKVVQQDGTERWEIVNATPIYDDNNRLIAGFVVFPDITQLKIAEKNLIQQKIELKESKSLLEQKNEEYEKLTEELQQTNEELRQTNEELFIAKENAEKNLIFANLITEQSPDIIYVFNLETEKNTFINKNLRKYLNYKKGEVPEDSTDLIIRLMHPDDVSNFYYSESIQTWESEYVHTYEYRLKDACGKWRWFSGREKEFQRSDNKLISVIGIVTDITLHKQAEKELIKAKERAEESDRLKTEFINNMSHEIRTPMNGILGFASLLDEPDLTREKRRHYINIINNSGKQLLRVIDDILEISKLGTKQIQANENEFCLNDLLLDLFAIFDIKAKENKTPLYLKNGLSDRKSIIISDSGKLHKILSNLLENALKFTKQGFIEFGYKLIDNNLEIYVKDTGVGIRSDKHEVIFERFSQEDVEISKKVGGLGLGLSIAKENAVLLGGNIRLISEKEKGATFIVTIPYKPVNKYEREFTESDLYDTKKNRSKTILIAEDEEINYLFIEALLTKIFNTDFEILHAKNGNEAIDICKENHNIDLVLMDIKMPVMDGFEATKYIKQLRPDLPVIAQTAYSTRDDSRKAHLYGCDDFITKPVEEKQFKEIINKYLVIK